MSKLFIIGNGFDMAHGIKSSYEDFHKYLDRNYEEKDCFYPELITMPDGDEFFNEDENVTFIKTVISNIEGDTWSKLEESLGYLELSDFFEEVSDLKDIYNNEDISRNICNALLETPNYFSEWIDEDIDLSDIKVKEGFKNLISIDDLFLSFNYTGTLEEIYEIKNVCHIHGCNSCGDKLLLGHGNFNNSFSSRVPIGAENYISKLYTGLIKDTCGAIKKHQDFFNKITNKIESIYSYGFSFGEVDLIYIKEILSKLDTKKVTWYFNKFEDNNGKTNDAEINEFTNKLKNYLGFKGEINTFTIDKKKSKV